MVKSLNIPVIDIDEAFSNQGDPLSFYPFRVGGHYNEEGYKFVAETILKNIEIQ